ncbi:MAG: transposase, partial [Defluviicoccus sp.]|nr:transposase [Defluviicoccus sp.]
MLLTPLERIERLAGLIWVAQAANDQEQVEPMLATLIAQSKVPGSVACLIADSGFCSEQSIKACETAGINPLIAAARDEHHPGWRERHNEPGALPENATPLQGMPHRLKSKAGRALYALRQQTVELVFGIIKSVMGFRQFSRRGQQQITGEWTLVCR